MQRKQYNSPVEALADQIKKGDLKTFKALYLQFTDPSGSATFNLDHSFQGHSLYEYSLIHDRREFFSFLLEQGHQESPPRQYTAELIRLIPNEDTFLYWLEKLHAHKRLTGFRGKDTYQQLTLIQHACLQSASSTIIQTLLQTGCTLALSEAFNPDLLEQRKQANRYLFRQKNLSTAILGDLLIYSTRQGDLESIRQGNPSGDVLSHVDDDNRTALSHAAESGHTDIVEYLLSIGAPACNAIHYAVNKRRKNIVEILLQHGGGAWQNLPAGFTQMDINANECYVEGMQINDVAVTPETKGFHRALHSAEDLAAFKKGQDQVNRNIATDKPLPIHSIKNTLTHLSNRHDLSDNQNLQKARDVLNEVSPVYSLKSLAAKIVHDNPERCTTTVKLAHRNPEDGTVTINTKTLNAVQYLSQVHPSIKEKVLDDNPEQQRALQIIEERIDELLAFYYYLDRMKYNKELSKEVQSHFAAAGLHLSYSLPSAYAAYTGLAFCGTWMTSHGNGCGPETVSCLTGNAMSFFGIPGFVVLGLTTIAALLTLNYVRQYGCDDGVCCGSDSPKPRIGVQPQLAATIATLIDVTKDEKLPAHVRDALNRISGDNLRQLIYRDLLAHLNTIRSYYAHTELKNIKDDSSQTPYANFKSGLFFWQEAELNAYRAAKTPPQVVMVDEPANNDFLFFSNSESVLNLEGRQPARLTMNDYESESEDNEEQPLLGDHKRH